MQRAIVGTTLLIMLCASAEARHRHHHRHHHARHHASVATSAHGVYGHDGPSVLAAKAPGYPSAWCGAWMADHMGVTGTLRRALWVARNWASWGHAASGPAEHVIGVKPHHVFEVLKVTRPGRVLAISGNDGHRVRIRERSTAGVIAWRAAPKTADIVD